MSTTQPVHYANRSRYAGSWEEVIPLAEAIADGRVEIGKGYTVTDEDVFLGSGRVHTLARREDLFATEAEARAACKARRAPRRTRQPLYGDFAQLAAFSGIRTDGSGRPNK